MNERYWEIVNRSAAIARTWPDWMRGKGKRKMEEIKLKPCPFCGGTAEFDEIATGPDWGGRYIQCVKCRVSTYVAFPVKESVDPLLVETWNARTPDLTLLAGDLLCIIQDMRGKDCAILLSCDAFKRLSDAVDSINPQRNR